MSLTSSLILAMCLPFTSYSTSQNSSSFRWVLGLIKAIGTFLTVLIIGFQHHNGMRLWGLKFQSMPPCLVEKIILAKSISWQLLAGSALSPTILMPFSDHTFHGLLHLLINLMSVLGGCSWGLGAPASGCTIGLGTGLGGSGLATA